MNFKSIFLAAAVGLTTFGVVPDAKAAQCISDPGWELCYSPVSTNGSLNTWDLTLDNSYNTEFMRVTCNNKSVQTFNSRGRATQAEAEWLADYFCAL